LERHIAELQGSYTAETMEPKNKEIHDEPPVALKEGENSRSRDKSKETSNNEINAETKELNKNKKDTIHFRNKRPRKRSTKRCHLCRKRGHIQKECPFSPVLQDWLWNDGEDKHCEIVRRVCSHSEFARSEYDIS